MSKLNVTVVLLTVILHFIHGEDITKDVFGDLKTCCPAAFGHFNGDKLTDVFMIDRQPTGTLVTVLTSHSDPPLLRETIQRCIFKSKVISLVPADFDGDGATDTLAVSIIPNNGTYMGQILWGNSTSWRCPEDSDFKLYFKSQPLVLDYNGDMITDIFAENNNSERTFWIFASNRKYPNVVHMNAKNKTLALNGGHAFIDIDQDLAADLWLVTQSSFELWRSTQDFRKPDIIQFPLPGAKFFGQSTFLDIDLDGKIELLIPLCKNGECFIYVYEFYPENQWYKLNILFKDENTSWTFKQGNELYTNTITPRVGDYNFDGYPDFLITMFDKYNNPQVILFENSLCPENCQHKRTFIPKWNLLNGYKSSVMGTFFDFNEDGALDVFLVDVNKANNSYSMKAFRNPLEFDATFVKVIVLTGQCYNNCSHDMASHGTNQPGPAIKYSITTAEGKLQKSCATQMFQNSHHALQLPFVTFGLGRNWNFVDKLEVGIPVSMSPNKTEFVHHSAFSQIIPNSQLVVVPYPKYEPRKWIHKLFITPSKAALLTAGALIGTCIFVLGIILLLHVFEKKKDKRERLQDAQRFHFVAM